MIKCPGEDIFKRNSASQKSAHAVMGSECLVLPGQEGGKRRQCDARNCSISQQTEFLISAISAAETSFSDGAGRS